MIVKPFLETNLRLRKWLAVSACKPPGQSKSVFLETLSKNLSTYLDTNGNVILLGDFNITPEDKNLLLFANTFNLERLIKKPTCFKESPSYMYLIITNRKAYFKKTYIIKWKIIFSYINTVSLKSQILKAPPNQKLYRDYKKCCQNSVNNHLKTKLDAIKILDHSFFEDIFMNVLNAHAPVKTEIIRANKFMSKALWKTIMTRYRLINV